MSCKQAASRVARSFFSREFRVASSFDTSCSIESFICSFSFAALDFADRFLSATISSWASASKVAVALLIPASRLFSPLRITVGYWLVTLDTALLKTTIKWPALEHSERDFRGVWAGGREAGVSRWAGWTSCVLDLQLPVGKLSLPGTSTSFWNNAKALDCAGHFSLGLVCLRRRPDWSTL